MSEWQLIGTAPCDHEMVMLWFEGARQPVFGATYRYNDGGVGASSSMARGVEFTHWMPLPEPPTNLTGGK